MFNRPALAVVLYRNGVVSFPELGVHLRMPASSPGGKCKIINSAEKAGKKKRGKNPVMSKQGPPFSL